MKTGESLMSHSLINEEIIRRFLTAIEQSDINILSELLHEGSIQRYGFPPPGFPEEIKGANNIVKQLSMTKKIFTNLQFINVVVYQAVDPTLMFTEFASTGIMKKNNQPYANNYCCKFIIHDGKIDEFTDYFDSYKTAQYFST